MRLVDLDALAGVRAGGKIYHPADVTIDLRPPAGVTVTVTYANNAQVAYEPAIVRFTGHEWKVEDGLLWLTSSDEAVCIPLCNVRDFRLAAA